MNMALGCDLILAADTARFSEIFARRGLSIDFGGSWILPRLVGMHRAKELALFGDIISAKEAQEMGLVNRVVPAGQLDALTADRANRLAAGPPLALAMTKRLLTNAFSGPKGLESTVVFLADPLAGLPEQVDVRIVRGEGPAQGNFRIARLRERDWDVQREVLAAPAGWDAHEAAELAYLQVERQRLL
jgi:enoyl-CoA hydratase/carnithine racemase